MYSCLVIDKNQIIELADQFLEGTKLFITEVRIKPVNRIVVMIDGDEGVRIDDCVALSRFIESKFDREADDFELTVTSAGIGEPLKFNRQYIKNIGRTIQVELTDDQVIEGQLITADEETITIERMVKEKINHKNIKKTDVKTIRYNEIRKAVVMVSFK
ncbi:MAG TPA: ribosome assembly cofactor RimP [Bacteroidales bacterium]|nr:MAG: ribosome assembly cofactor RimP [Bacteroidetes bacterium HGW-Bacteroidetes-22]HBZ67726.1 ribosome assembly cofactor RimP [Bacteroidales bacterium]